MESALTEEQILQRAAEVADRDILPNSKHNDETGEFPIESVRALGRAGLLGLLVPTAYGGLGGNIETYIKVAERIARACPSTAMIWVMHHTQYIMVATHGTDQQKEFFLPAVARGESLIASGTTEPETGGIPDFCASSKRVDGDSLVISAKKPVVTSAKFADWVFVTTRANPEAPGNMLSIVAIPGLAGKGGRDDLRPFGVWDCVGMRATGSSGLELVEARVPHWYRIGPDDARTMCQSTMLVLARAGYSAVWLGIAQAALDATVAHLTKRTHQLLVGNRRDGVAPPSVQETKKPDEENKPVQVQRTLADYETVQRQVGELRARVEAARSLITTTARLLDQHAADVTKAPYLQEMLWSTRITCGETAIDVCRIALRICGVTGMRRGVLPLERHMRDALTAQVMAQSEDLAKLSLGKKTLGLI